MPDLLPSTRRPLHPSRSRTSIKLNHGIPPAAGNPFKFAHLSGDDSIRLGSHDVPLSMMNPVGNLIAEATAMVVS